MQHTQIQRTALCRHSSQIWNRDHIHSCVECMAGPAQENSVDGTDVAIVTPPSHRDVAVRGHAIVRRIEIDPPGAWAPRRTPGGALCAATEPPQARRGTTAQIRLD